jgi:hypothetical protein
MLSCRRLLAGGDPVTPLEYMQPLASQHHPRDMDPAWPQRDKTQDSNPSTLNATE